MNSEKVYKTFIAFSVDERSVLSLSHVQNHIKPRLKTVHWVRPEKFHITAAYLDMLTIEQVTKAAVAIEQFQEKVVPIKVKVTGIEGFPGKQNARIIYAKLGGNNLIYFLDSVSDLRKNLEEHGISFDTKPFIPHITIGRAKTPQNLLKLKDGGSDNKITIYKVAVYISEQTDEGYRYREMKR